MAERVLHLVFSPLALTRLSSRVGGSDCVVMMEWADEVDVMVNWPSGVDVFSLNSAKDAPPQKNRIEYSDLVALTCLYPKVLSW